MPAPQKPDLKDLPTLAHHLLTSGPLKTHPAAPRRVRILHHGAYILDTTSAVYVWEHAGYPYFYVPRADFSDSVRLERGEEVSGQGRKAWVVRMHGKGWSNDRVVEFDGELEKERERHGKEALRGMVRVEFGVVDQWLEEESPTLVHPKDPFKRIDCLPSLRRIRVTLPHPRTGEEIELANSPTSVHLHEGAGLLPVRYYLPLTSLSVEYLRKSETRSVCPYKGEAEYYDVVLPDENGEGNGEVRDLVWYYDRPNLEVAQVEKMCCFYAEKCDVWIDGVKLDRPKTWFS